MGPRVGVEAKLTRPDQLTLDLMLALLPPLLQLLPVIIQPLQTHDAILETGSVGTQHLSQGIGVTAFLPTRPPSVPTIVGAGPLHPAQRTPGTPKFLLSGLAPDLRLLPPPAAYIPRPPTLPTPPPTPRPEESVKVNLDLVRMHH